MNKAGINGQRSRKGGPAKYARPPRRHRHATAAYLALVRAYPIHPIRSEDDLDAAITVVDKLLSRRKALTEQS